MSEPIAEVALREGHAPEHGDAVRAMFDRIARTYDRSNRVMSAGVDVLWRRRAVRALGEVGGGPVLDLCAGTMDLTALLAKAFPRARVVACDFSAAMLDAGRAKAPRADVVVADALALPFADGEMRAVIAGFGVRNLADTARGAREVFRVLRPGGVFVTLEFFRPVTGVSRAFHRVYAEHVLPALGGAISGEREAYAYLARSMDGFMPRADYQHLLRDVGFVNVRGEDLTFGVASIVRAEVPS
jgi:ubiquinone/menaquinone biosynthesis methyltransferase